MDCLTGVIEAPLANGVVQHIYVFKTPNGYRMLQRSGTPTLADAWLPPLEHLEHIASNIRGIIFDDHRRYYDELGCNGLRMTIPCASTSMDSSQVDLALHMMKSCGNISIHVVSLDSLKTIVDFSRCKSMYDIGPVNTGEASGLLKGGKAEDASSFFGSAG